MKKRFLSGILALLLVISCFGGLTASAAAAPVKAGLAKLNYGDLTASDIAIINEASTYAYMSLENASVAMKEKIIEAREDIIFHQSWSIDGQSRVIREDGTIEYLPAFYDVFPTDWNIPVVDTYTKAVKGTSPLLASTLTAGEPKEVYYKGTPVPRAQDATNSYCFVWYTALCDIRISTIQPIEFRNVTSVNCGLTNGTTGQSVNHKMNMSEYDALETDVTWGVTYGCRVSNNQNVTNATALMFAADGPMRIIPDDPIPVW